MRKPSALSDLYAWHRQALAGLKPPIHHEPQPGWFTRRLVQGGPLVAARIWMHQEIDAETGDLTAPEELRCEVGGKARDAIDEWTYLADSPITEADYNYMMADAAWLKQHHPGAPEANPHERVHSRAIPQLF